MTRPWIVEIESAIDAALPKELQVLYERADGESDATTEGRRMRLLSSAEAIRTYQEFSEISDLRNSCPFWTSDNGDYAAIFFAGPLRGRIYFWEHIKNYPSDPVAYRSTDSFLESLNAAAEEELDWYEMSTDYLVDTSYYSHGAGVCKPATAEAIESDRQAFQAMLDLYRAGDFRDEYDEQFFAKNAIALAPPDATAAILEFLDSDDMYVQERVCKALGHRRYEPAVERLERLACEARGNGQTAAIAALGKIGNAAAREAILRSVAAFGPGQDFWLAKALDESGCETRFEEDKFRVRTYFYRLPSATEWSRLR